VPAPFARTATGLDMICPRRVTIGQGGEATSRS
jgi:hypothetical protein